MRRTRLPMHGRSDCLLPRPYRAHAAPQVRERLAARALRHGREGHRRDGQARHPDLRGQRRAAARRPLSNLSLTLISPTLGRPLRPHPPPPPQPRRCALSLRRCGHRQRRHGALPPRRAHLVLVPRLAEAGGRGGATSESRTTRTRPLARSLLTRMLTPALQATLRANRSGKALPPVALPLPGNALLVPVDSTRRKPGATDLRVPSCADRPNRSSAAAHHCIGGPHAVTAARCHAGRYAIFGGLVFVPLCEPYLRSEYGAWLNLTSRAVPHPRITWRLPLQVRRRLRREGADPAARAVAARRQGEGGRAGGGAQPGPLARHQRGVRAPGQPAGGGRQRHEDQQPAAAGGAGGGLARALPHLRPRAARRDGPRPHPNPRQPRPLSPPDRSTTIPTPRSRARLASLL